MSLKTYISPVIQDFQKSGSGWLLFGLQSAPTYKLLDIYDAYAKLLTADSGDWTADSGIITADQGTFDIISLTAVKLDINGNEIGRTSLATDLLTWSTNQWIVDSSKLLASLLNECIYYLEIGTSEETIQSEPFLVSIMDIFLKADQIFWTADSGIITADQAKITI